MKIIVFKKALAVVLLLVQMCCIPLSVNAAGRVKYHYITGILKLGINDKAPAGGFKCWVKAQCGQEAYFTKVTIAKGKTQTSYKVIVPYRGKRDLYTVSYKPINAAGYIREGFYGHPESGTMTSSCAEMAVPIDISRQKTSTAHMTILKSRTISGRLSLPAGEQPFQNNIKIGLRFYTINSRLLGDSARNSVNYIDFLVKKEITIPKGYTSVPYSVEVPIENYSRQWDTPVPVQTEYFLSYYLPKGTSGLDDYLKEGYYNGKSTEWFECWDGYEVMEVGEGYGKFYSVFPKKIDAVMNPKGINLTLLKKDDIGNYKEEAQVLNSDLNINGKIDDKLDVDYFEFTAPRDGIFKIKHQSGARVPVTVIASTVSDNKYQNEHYSPFVGGVEGGGLAQAPETVLFSCLKGEKRFIRFGRDYSYKEDYVGKEYSYCVETEFDKAVRGQLRVPEGVKVPSGGLKVLFKPEYGHIIGTVVIPGGKQSAEFNFPIPDELKEPIYYEVLNPLPNISPWAVLTDKGFELDYIKSQGSKDYSKISLDQLDVSLLKVKEMNVNIVTPENAWYSIEWISESCSFSRDDCVSSPGTKKLTFIVPIHQEDEAYIVKLNKRRSFEGLKGEELEEESYYTKNGMVNDASLAEPVVVSLANNLSSISINLDKTPEGLVLFMDAPDEVNVFINGTQIPSYGSGIITVEDLAKCGYDIQWLKEGKECRLTRNINKKLVPGSFKDYDLTGTLSTTDKVLYIDNKYIVCLDLNGKLALHCESLHTNTTLSREPNKKWNERWYKDRKY